MANFGMMLKKLRIQKGVSCKEVGDLIDVSESSVRKYESGDRTPTPDAILAFAKFFDVTTDYLLVQDSLNMQRMIITPIGSRIIALRENKGITQKQLAEKISINPSVMNRIESGERAVRDEEIKKISAFFGVTTDYLLGRDNLSIKNSLNISSEDLELLNQIKKASPKKRKAIELILDI